MTRNRFNFRTADKLHIEKALQTFKVQGSAQCYNSTVSLTIVIRLIAACRNKSNNNTAILLACNEPLVATDTSIVADVGEVNQEAGEDHYAIRQIGPSQLSGTEELCVNNDY